MPHLGDVADTPEDAVGDSRCASRPERDLGRGVVVDRDAEDAGGAPDDHRQLLGLVVAEPERQAEAVAQRGRQQAGAGSRADERELRQVECQRPRGRPLSDDDVEPEILERRIEDLLDRAVDAMDLVDEEDVTQLEAGEDRGHVALPLQRRPGDVADADAELLADDLRERRLAEPGRPDEQHVVECLAPRLGGREGNRELFLDGFLADELVQSTRAERAFELLLLGAKNLRGDGAQGGGCPGGGNVSEPFGGMTASCCLPQSQSHPLLGRKVWIDRGERLLGLDHGVAELDEGIAGRHVAGRADGARDRHRILRAELLLQLEHDPLGGLLADTGDRLETRRVLEHDRPAEVGRGRAGDDRERDLRADPRHGEEMEEELALGCIGEAVELQSVFAYVEVRLHDSLTAPLGRPHRTRGRREQVADAVHVEHEAVGRPSRECSSQPPDHPAIRRSGGASAWQIATARASAA